MILSMRMRNIALIEELSLEFGEGLHVMTGETGAGKSIVVDAVNLVLGGRAARELIRTGTDKAWVEAVFDASGNAEVAKWAQAQELDDFDGTVTLYREITRSGRNLCRVCGVVMPLSALKDIAVLLMDVHGQHEAQFLMNSQYHLLFLDAAGGDDYQALLSRVDAAYQAFITNHRQYARLVKENEKKQYRMESLKKSLEVSPDLKALYDADTQVHDLIDTSLKVEGMPRHASTHAAGVVITRDPATEYVPLSTNDGLPVTQFNMVEIERLGLLKMDFLGLRTLDVLSIACRNIEERTGTKIVPEEIPTDDELAFKLMQSGNMDGLFQVEGALYVSLFKRLPPKQFSDVVASIALNRPGPLESGMVEDYIKAAKNPAAVHYYDDRLRPILEETHGTMVYQEQIMQISMAMSGFSAGKSDKLRKAMGKKKLDIMRQLQADWDEGAVANGYPLEIAQQIWADAEKFAKYAFNKSHSAAYAILVMRTAYLKAHYPNDFMAAVLTSYMGNTDRLIRYIASCNKNGTPVLPPDINASRAEFTPVEGGIRFGLVGVRGVGKNVADEIIAEREANGPFTSLHDFVNRLDAKCYNRKTLEALIKGGAFDSTGYTRKQLMYFVEETPLLEGAAKRQKDRDAGQVSMFDMFADDADSGFQEDVPAPDGVEWDKRTKLAYEKEIMKIYVSEHPLAPFEGTLRRMSRYDMGMLSEQTKEIKNGVFVGMISNVATKLTKRGTKMATFTLEDTTGSIECICFKYDDFAEVIQEDVIAKIKGKFESGDRGNQIMAFELEALELDEEDARPSHLELRVPSRSFDQNRSAHLSRILNSYPGRDGVVLFVQQADGRRFRAELPVSVDAQSTVLKAEIRDLFGPEAMIA